MNAFEQMKRNVAHVIDTAIKSNRESVRFLIILGLALSTARELYQIDIFLDGHNDEEQKEELSEAALHQCSSEVLRHLITEPPKAFDRKILLTNMFMLTKAPRGLLENLADDTQTNICAKQSFNLPRLRLRKTMCQERLQIRTSTNKESASVAEDDIWFQIAQMKGFAL